MNDGLDHEASEEIGNLFFNIPVEILTAIEHIEQAANHNIVLFVGIGDARDLSHQVS